MVVTETTPKASNLLSSGECMQEYGRASPAKLKLNGEGKIEEESATNFFANLLLKPNVKQYPWPMTFNHPKDSTIFVASFGALPIAANSSETLTKAYTEMSRLFVMPASAKLRCMRRGCKFVASNMIIEVWHKEHDCCTVIPDMDKVALREITPAFYIHENVLSILESTTTPTDGKWDVLDVESTPIGSGPTVKHKTPQLVNEVKAETNWLKHQVKQKDLFDFLVWKQSSMGFKARTNLQNKGLPILMAMSFLKAEKYWPADFRRNVQLRHDVQKRASHE